MRAQKLLWTKEVTCRARLRPSRWTEVGREPDEGNSAVVGAASKRASLSHSATTAEMTAALRPLYFPHSTCDALQRPSFAPFVEDESATLLFCFCCVLV